MSPRGKTVVVTGAARGIGRACAELLAAAGADLVLVDVPDDLPLVPYPLGTEGQLAHTEKLCRAHGAAVLSCPADIRDLRAVEAAVAAAVARFGRLDAVVNNAGIAAPSGKVVHEIGEDEWSVMLDVDLSGAWRMTRAAGEVMTRQRSGSIVNISSTAGLVGYRDFAAYVTAKHGLIGLTRAAALDFAPLKVRVNAVCPGSVRDDPGLEGRMLSEIAKSLDVPVAEHEEIFVQAQPTNELVEAGDVAEAVLWLVGDGSRGVTGSVVTVDGGFTAK
ncbi:SDR family oxidoreductase [Streptomyces griseiscabiei]|uniref:SDR family oxidoreductase n=1 Tax=Streptomyces griseiscabiei TaxID=2993540 RepID=A0ABU4L209_9ACTN|nr:SDR family oxidoreductase [Streptomyces griseiscabiei]MBZ3906092.1 SDR family oxidoreductase [Streptomyces griseiscabiei]MDX2909726.1 SDR family oxidoreductase [Streptomyces griseiscabiei]